MRDLFLRLKKRYLGLRLQKKLFLFLSLIISISALLSLSAVYFSYQALRRQHYEASAKFLNLAAAAINNDLEQVKRLTLQAATDLQIQDQLAVLNTDPALFYSDARSKLEALLERYSVLEDYVDALSVLDKNGGEIITGKRRLPLSVEQKAEFIHLAEKAGGRAVWHSVENSNWLFCIRADRQIAPFNLQFLGATIIRINKNTLLNKYAYLLNDIPENILIFSQNQIIFSSRPEPVFLLQADALPTSGYFSQKYQDKLYFVSFQKVPYTNFFYASLIDDQLISGYFNFLYLVIASFYLLILLLSFFISHYFSLLFTRPISRLSAHMRTVEDGFFQLPPLADVSLASANEMEHLRYDFDAMLRRIHDLIQENYVKQLSLQDSKYRILQSQVNPHFLYNTLTSINSLAKISGQNEISLMVEALAKLLRSSLNNEQTLNSIENEIDILNNYLQIEKIRYGSRLDIEVLIPPELYPYQIPVFTLQPLVQNSVKYTLEYRRGISHIRVTAETRENGLYLIVTDNGIGMTADELQKLKTNQVEPKGLGIGIKNIHERIQLLFGSNYGLSFDSEKDKGTTVSVYLPQEVTGRVFHPVTDSTEANHV